MSRNISEKTLRFLYGKSVNKCAFPDCNEPIFELNGMLTGECCHIEAFSPGGARYNISTSAKEKNIENNLILLCARCLLKVENRKFIHPIGYRLELVSIRHIQAPNNYVEEIGKKSFKDILFGTKCKVSRDNNFI